MLKAFTGALHIGKPGSKRATALHEHSHGTLCRIWTPPRCFIKHCIRPWDDGTHTNSKKNLKLRNGIRPTLVFDHSEALSEAQRPFQAEFTSGEHSHICKLRLLLENSHLCL